MTRGRSGHGPWSWSAVVAESLAFLLATCCAGCDSPGWLTLCPACREAVRPQTLCRLSPAGLPVFAGGIFEGPRARAIRAVKQAGATALVRELAPALAASLRAACIGRSDALTVAVPTSRAAFRRRGYRVPQLLLYRAGGRDAKLLLPGRRVADQRDLGRSARLHNILGSMRLRCEAGARGSAAVVLVDDVVTTGATLDEAAAVLRAGGWRVHAAAVLAATPVPDRLGPV